MTGGWTRVPVASLAGLLPAIFGAMIFARLAASGTDRLLMASMALGIVCGVVVMAVARGRGWDVVAGAVAVSLVGIALALLFDAKWNSVSHVARQLMSQHTELDLVTATMQARTIVGGMTLGELARGHLHPRNLLMPTFAAFGAGFTVRSRLFGRLLRISDTM